MITDQDRLEAEALEPPQAQITRFEPQHHPVPASMQAVPLTGTEMKMKLAIIRDVMATAMVQGQDYGLVPGCGPKPGLFQPGAQKLSMMFQLNPEVRSETINDYPGYHRGFRFVVRVTNGTKFADGVGECATLESKYRYRNTGRKCPKCGAETIIKGKAEYGGGWVCFSKKGGCGAKFADDAPEMANAAATKIEHDNPPDYWNTVRKMAFKRAFVHAIINATNTSELWSQDLEDLAGNGVVAQHEEHKEPVREIKGAKGKPPARQEPAASAPASGQAEGITAAKGMMLEKWEPKHGKTAKGPWTLHIGRFATDSGSVVEACTFDAALGERMAKLEGQECDITYKPGRKAGTLELLTIEPADNVPMDGRH